MTQSEDFLQQRQRLLDAASKDQPRSGLEPRVIAAALKRKVRKRRKRQWGAALLSAAGISAALFFLPTGNDTRMIATPEPVLPEEPEAPAMMQPPQEGPFACDSIDVAAGDAPLIDDFESGEAGVLELEGRTGAWALVTDQNADSGKDLTIAPRELPAAEQSNGNRYAMHLAGGELRMWGASLEYNFEPSLCYDARAYRGIRFRARGKVRLRVSARQADFIPVEHGGLCTEDCYVTHVAAIDLSEEWTLYEIPWEKLRRRGYDSGPLDAGRIHSLQFLIQPEDTPFDVWIDDVEFL